MRTLSLFLGLCLLFGVSSLGASGLDIRATDLGLPSASMQDDVFFSDFDSETRTVIRVSDPLHHYNRFMTGFNDIAYRYAIIPTARGYGAVMPKPVRLGISNAFSNLFFPIRFVNNVLQFKFKNAGVELARFTVNSTVGIGGLFDPAKHWLDLSPKREDFGQTLGRFGVGNGPYFVWPILGPSNFRDSIGMIADGMIDPITLTTRIGDTMSLKMAKSINEVSLNPDEYDTLRNASLDFYTFMKDGYTQRRLAQILE